MRIFSPPKTTYVNYDDQGAFDLTWRYNTFMMLSYPALILAGALINLEVFVGGIGAFLVPVLSLLWLKKTRKYEAVAYFQVVTGSIATGIILNFNVVHVHTIEMIFMLIVVLYAFIALGIKIGIISLALQFVWFLIYFLNIEVEPNVTFTIAQNFALLIVLLVGISLFGFLIIEFLKLRKIAENKYLMINKDLNEINHLVNAQYQEKTVMLKEIHHRVKNNLQVISSLLRLQSYEIEEEAYQMHFQDAIVRVSAMALIHEKMYQNENLSQINIRNYIESLAADIIETHTQRVAIELKVKSDVLELGNDSLVPLALIINELITNSLKHAFTGAKEGLIEVNIRRIDESDFFSFTYSDSGNWKGSSKNGSFGLELIATLTEQLDGELERFTEKGTTYHFKLKDLK